MQLKLTEKMEEVLIMAANGLREAEIARRLGISRQAVNKTLREARSRLTLLFVALADVFYSDIVKINVNKGYAVLRNRQTGTKLYMIYVPGKGPRVVFRNNIDCTLEKTLCDDIIYSCSRLGILDECKETKPASEQLSVLVKRILDKLEE
ncbi:sigma-70 region 4 domain-containing protein [Desulfurococcaceae archaeon MEX13E-LK6-19]|nr:sigma-70 region 4 domain-containing protein [Desulfurococcaceae archaeon MEX13E-LK6-19]